MASSSTPPDEVIRAIGRLAIRLVRDAVEASQRTGEPVTATGAAVDALAVVVALAELGLQDFRPPAGDAVRDPDSSS